MKDERFPHLGKPLHQWGDQVGQKGSFRDSEDCSSQFAIAQRDTSFYSSVHGVHSLVWAGAKC